MTFNSDWIQNEFIPFIAEYSNYFGNPIKEDIYGYYYPQFVLHSVPETNKIKYLLVEKLKQVMVPYMFTMDYLL